MPPQAWLLHIADDRHCLYCGNNVEEWRDGFFEGAWAGNFDGAGFAACPEVFGSGGLIVDGHWKLVPPSHTLEAIYALKLKRGEWLVSNSLAYIYGRTGFRFLWPSRRIIESFVGIVQGIDHSPTRVPTSAGELYVISHVNVKVGPDDLVSTRKPPTQNFSNYLDYRGYLGETVLRVAANASTAMRRRSYRLLATISSGYDSPACASIARGAGCREAITFINARGGALDDGTELGRLLGMKITAYVRQDKAGCNDACCAEFFANGMQGEDIVYDALRGTLSGVILVTGFHGDKIWDRSAPPSSTLKRGDISGSSLGEFRLREGFVHLPLPFSGALHHEMVRRISNSAEMLGYTVGGSYDRPIPRRIVEESGVPRHLFGQRKKAISLLLFVRNDLLPQAVRKEILSLLERKSAFDRCRYFMGCVRFETFMFIRRVVETAGRHLHWRIRRILEIASEYLFNVLLGQPSEIFEHSHPFGALALEWSLDAVAERYDLSDPIPRRAS